MNAYSLSSLVHLFLPQQAVRETATICPRHCKLTVDLYTLKVVFESHVTWATSVPIPRSLSSRLRPDVRDRQTSDAHHRLMPPNLWWGHNKTTDDYLAIEVTKMPHRIITRKVITWHIQSRSLLLLLLLLL